MRMDWLVSQALAWAHVIECALHDSGPWSFRTSAGSTPAHRLFDRERCEIIFSGLVAPSADRVIELWSGERFVTMTMADITQGDQLTWKIALAESARAS